MPSEIPVVSLPDFDGSSAARAGFVRDFGGALREFGFVLVEGHGVDHELIDQAYDLVERLFALPDEVKGRYDVPASGGNRGYVPLGRERARGRDASDLKEFWHVGRELPSSHPLARVYHPNVWPAELPALKSTMLELSAQLETCARRLLTAVAECLALPPETFTRMIEDGNSVLRAIHYPPVPADAPPHALRAAEHEDINLMTILCEATAAGLEVLARDGRWIPIHALDRHMVVDTGDMMKLCSNDRLPATTHRVANPDGPNVSRYSLPYFVHPYPGCVLEPLCVGPDDPPRYRRTTAGEFLDARLREIGLLA